MRGSCATNYWFVRPRITVLYARLFSPTNFWFVSEVVVCHQLRVVQFYLLPPPPPTGNPRGKSSPFGPGVGNCLKAA